MFCIKNVLEILTIKTEDKLKAVINGNIYCFLQLFVLGIFNDNLSAYDHALCGMYKLQNKST